MSKAHNPIQDIYLRVVEKGDNKVLGVAAKALADSGAGCKMGCFGAGSMCYTVSGAGGGVPQITAIDIVVTVLAGMEVPVIVYGGVGYSGDRAKDIAAGASSVGRSTW